MDARTRKFILERLLTTEEAAKRLGIATATVRQWIARHKLDFVLKGATALVDKKDIDKIKTNGSTANGIKVDKKPGNSNKAV